MKKHTVITGSTRGIGFGLARQFLSLGYSVTIIGRRKESVESALATLEENFSREQIHGTVWDVHDWDKTRAVWDETVDRFGRIDVWINNAGIYQPDNRFSEIGPGEVDNLIRTNLLAAMIISGTVYRCMAAQGVGALYNMEGLGSDGRKIPGTILYGTSKQAIRYFTDGLAMETAGGPVLVGTLSPGMVLTDLLLEPVRQDPEAHKESLKIYRILADEVGPVTEYLARKVDRNTKHGVKISWLTTWKVLGRFIGSIFKKRKIVDRYLENIG